MATKTTEKQCSWQMLPMWEVPEWDWGDWEGNMDKAKAKAGDFRDDFQAFWEAGIAWQKDAIVKSKDQYEQLFANMQDANDSFAAFLPDWEIPFMPEAASSPKKLRKQFKEWEKMANEHFEKQVDSIADFVIKGQEKACSELPEVPDAPKKAEKPAKAEPKAEEEEPAKKASKKPAKKGAAKSSK